MLPGWVPKSRPSVKALDQGSGSRAFRYRRTRGRTWSPKLVTAVDQATPFSGRGNDMNIPSVEERWPRTGEDPFESDLA